MTGNALCHHWLGRIEERLAGLSEPERAGYREAAGLLAGLALPDASPGEARAMALAWLRARPAGPARAWVIALVEAPLPAALLVAPPTGPYLHAASSLRSAREALASTDARSQARATSPAQRGAVPSRPADVTAFVACPACGHASASAVCPCCGAVTRDGPAELAPPSCPGGACARCRACFTCGLDAAGTRCPRCGIPRGWSFTTCPSCEAREAVFMPHWGHACNAYTLDCSRCRSRHHSLCIC